MYDFTRREIGQCDAVLKQIGRACPGGSKVDDIVSIDQSSILESGLDDELAVFDEDVLVVEGCLLEFAVATNKGSDENTTNALETKTYPKPPTSASFVQMSVLNPPEKSSLRTGQYL